MPPAPTSHRQAALAAVLLLGALPGTARAEETIEGPVCVADGRTLFISGMREQGQCRGGVKVRLYGIDAPDPEQRCVTTTGAPYACGISALTALEDLTWRRTLRCDPRGPVDRDRALPATCLAAEDDLAAALVRKGWAIVDPRQSDEYAAEQEAARGARRGLWAGRFDIPWMWRQERRR